MFIADHRHEGIVEWQLLHQSTLLRWYGATDRHPMLCQVIDPIDLRLQGGIGTHRWQCVFHDKRLTVSRETIDTVIWIVRQAAELALFNAVRARKLLEK